MMLNVTFFFQNTECCTCCGVAGRVGQIGLYFGGRGLALAIENIHDLALAITQVQVGFLGHPMFLPRAENLANNLACC